MGNTREGFSALGIGPSKTHLGAAFFLLWLSFRGPPWLPVQGKKSPNAHQFPLPSQSTADILSCPWKLQLEGGMPERLRLCVFWRGLGSSGPARQAESRGSSFPC